jgi:integrase
MIGSLGSLYRMLRFAIRRKWITDNRVAGLEPEERPSIDAKDKRVLTPDELRALIDAASPDSRAFIATLALTGLRQSEALGLTWQDIDLDAGLVRLRYQLERGGRGRVKLKTPAARRDVVMLPALSDLLRRHREESLA